MQEHGPAAYIYFSLETFTTQSIGDIVPIGQLRLLAAVQPLVGLILIGWSTSFTFLIMRRDWQWDDERGARN
ncbi:ion channel [Cupriavidus metallidurans]